MVTPPSLFCDTCGAANQPRASYCHACGRPLQGTQPTVYNSATGRLLANVLLKQRYHIIAPTGKGGMGAVYKAEDTQLGNRLVAIKEMSQSGLSLQEVKDAANAFKQEAILLAGLQHPNLPSIFDHFEENGRWYLVMSFIQGETLTDHLSQAKAGKPPLDEALRIGLQLCDVLDYLHAQQPPIVFRDLKPANIMRTASGHIYLIDFGIARHFKPGQAKDTVYYGSMGYAPPEQYGRAQTTPRSDIYSLGATLHQLISGHDPSSSPFRFPLLQSLVPTVPTNLATLITQMLELDEDKRPASILFVKQELQTLASPAAQKPSSPSSVAPTQLASSLAPAASAQPAAKPVRVWAFGKMQVVTTLILAVCYSIVSIVILGLSPAFYLELGFLWLLPIFFASYFGPWVGTGATGIGFYLAYFFLIRIDLLYRWEIAFWGRIGAILVFSAFLAGLFLFKTKGQYGKFGNILFVWLLGLLEICLGLMILYVTHTSPYYYYPDFNPFSSYFSGLLPLIVPTLVLLPLLLLVSNAISRAWDRRSI